VTHPQGQHFKLLGAASTQALTRRYEAEIRLLQALGNTPGFPAYRRDGVTESGVRYVIYSEVPGQALSALLCRRADSEPPLQVGLPYWHSVVAQLLELVGHLHGMPFPVFHGDISPANVIVSETGRVGLIDFGVARSRLLPYPLRFHSRQSTAAPLYLSPEQAVGRWWGSASDIYQVGLVTMELITGQSLGRGLNVPELLTRLRQNPGYAQTIALHTQGLPNDFLAALLNPVPAKRPSARQALALLKELHFSR
jgi:serine/threonine protein kinase